MGFWKRIREEFLTGLNEHGASARPPRSAVQSMPAAVRRPNKDIEVVGESYYPTAFSEIFSNAGRPLGGQLMRTATLVPEPDNLHDENAVAVHVERRLVGYVPAALARRVQRFALAENAKGRDVTVSSRIWGSAEDGGWHARVTLLFVGPSEPEWSYVDEAKWQGDRSPDGAQRLTARGYRARGDKARVAAEIDGRHFDFLRDDIRQAKNKGDLNEAARLVSMCVDAAETSAAVYYERPVVWPTEQAAIVFRALKDYPAEVGVLQRFIAADPDKMGTQKIRDRLDKAQALAQKHRRPDTVPQLD